MSQLALVYDASHEGDAAWKERLSWLRRAVDVVGHKEVAYKLDVQPSQLTDALLERERKDVKAKWFDIVLRMVSHEMRAEYLRIECEPLGFEAPKAKKKKTAEEREREREKWLKENARVVFEQMERDLG